MFRRRLGRSGDPSAIQQPSSSSTSTETERRNTLRSNDTKHKYKTMSVLLMMIVFTVFFFRCTLSNIDNNKKTSIFFSPTSNTNIIITTPIPPNFIINTKSGLHNEPLLVQKNVENNLILFPNYTFIQDDDASCLQKMKQIPTFSNSNHTISWFQSNETLGMFKSDACRLAQLYIHGGVYLDNDLELRLSILDLIGDGYDVITAVSLNDEDIFQAILAASPRHALILRSMEIMVDEIPKIDPIKPYKGGWLGPKSLRMAMEELLDYKVKMYSETQRNMTEKGVYLLKEFALESHPVMNNRSMDRHCNIAIKGGSTVYGFSRFKAYGTIDEKCSTATT